MADLARAKAAIAKAMLEGDESAKEAAREIADHYGINFRVEKGEVLFEPAPEEKPAGEDDSAAKPKLKVELPSDPEDALAAARAAAAAAAARGPVPEPEPPPPDQTTAGGAAGEHFIDALLQGHGAQAGGAAAGLEELLQPGSGSTEDLQKGDLYPDMRITGADMAKQGAVSAPMAPRGPTLGLEMLGAIAPGLPQVVRQAISSVPQSVQEAAASEQVRQGGELEAGAREHPFASLGGTMAGALIGSPPIPGLSVSSVGRALARQAPKIAEAAPALANVARTIGSKVAPAVQAIGNAARAVAATPYIGKPLEALGGLAVRGARNTANALPQAMAEGMMTGEGHGTGGVQGAMSAVAPVAALGFGGEAVVSPLRAAGRYFTERAGKALSVGEEAARAFKSIEAAGGTPEISLRGYNVPAPMARMYEDAAKSNSGLAASEEIARKYTQKIVASASKVHGDVVSAVKRDKDVYFGTAEAQRRVSTDAALRVIDDAIASKHGPDNLPLSKREVRALYRMRENLAGTKEVRRRYADAKSLDESVRIWRDEGGDAKYSPGVKRVAKNVASALDQISKDNYAGLKEINRRYEPVLNDLNNSLREIGYNYKPDKIDDRYMSRDWDKFFAAINEYGLNPNRTMGLNQLLEQADPEAYKLVRSIAGARDMLEAVHKGKGTYRTVANGSGGLSGYFSLPSGVSRMGGMARIPAEIPGRRVTSAAGETAAALTDEQIAKIIVPNDKEN